MAGAKNGILLSRAADAGAADSGFEVFLTADRNLPHQQHVPALRLALVVLAVRDQRMQTIRPLVADILAVLASQPKPGTVTFVVAWRIG